MLRQLRQARLQELVKVAEYADRSNFLKKTFEKQWDQATLDNLRSRLQASSITEKEIKTSIDGGLLTYLLHCEARIASYLGKGFYTIGPCGEEVLGFGSHHFRPYDLTALHYRHLSTSVVKTLSNNAKTLDQIALDRARGFTVSSLDPVTSGRHCSIGGDPETEFLVTSTLASQAPPAVGRALAISLSHFLYEKNSSPNKKNPKFNKNAISYVSLGDGSVNNGHFLTALNLAKYAEHNKAKCPVVFAISDNQICISLKGNGYIDKFVEAHALHNQPDDISSYHPQSSPGIFTQTCDGTDFLDVYEKTKKVVEFSRQYKRPSLILMKNLPRRFGHAATDRQFAYLTEKEIEDVRNRDPLSDTISKLISLGIYQKDEVENLFNSMQQMVEKAFDDASEEPKVTSREYLVETTSQPLVPVKNADKLDLNKPTIRPLLKKEEKIAAANGERPDVMRKQMTRVFDEILGEDQNAVYIGEDVQHGGYYLVTDGLNTKYPQRVRDFPPDETTLVGAAMGFSQSGLTTFLEIPYSKYLDCGGDMFYEAIIANWLSNGKQPNGMVVRLQGFDKGIFGGNYHTHNMLSIPPGLDVVCFSNGYDYVRGMRYLNEQAKAGRVVMSVDCTDLLNRRHLDDNAKDEFLLTAYPVNRDENPYHFDQVLVYPSRESTEKNSYSKKDIDETKEQIVLVTYGNGLPTSLLAQQELQSKYPEKEIIVIDSPCLSKTPQQLIEYMKKYQKNISSIVFVDICKYGPAMPLNTRVTDLQQLSLLPAKWRAIGATPTYNPLGTYLTFTSVDDILKAVEETL